MFNCMCMTLINSMATNYLMHLNPVGEGTTDELTQSTPTSSKGVNGLNILYSFTVSCNIINYECYDFVHTLEQMRFSLFPTSPTVESGWVIPLGSIKSSFPHVLTLREWRQPFRAGVCGRVAQVSFCHPELWRTASPTGNSPLLLSLDAGSHAKLIPSFILVDFHSFFFGSVMFSCFSFCSFIFFLFLCFCLSIF